MKWVSVQERVPELETTVLVWMDGRCELMEWTWYLEAAPHWENANFHTHYLSYQDDITHWMELPIEPVDDRRAKGS